MRRGAKRDVLPPGTDWREEFLKLAAAECLTRVGPADSAVQVVRQAIGLPPAIAFHRRRRDIGGPTRVFGYISLTTASPIPRPKAFGYGCHYGLGLLRPRLG